LASTAAIVTVIGSSQNATPAAGRELRRRSLRLDAMLLGDVRGEDRQPIEHRSIQFRH
jgi:hypothetical protein